MSDQSQPVKNREEHLQWCKDRALAYVDHGDLEGAYTSMASDLQKHAGTENHAGIALGISLLMSGLLSTNAEMRKFIQGFN